MARLDSRFAPAHSRLLAGCPALAILAPLSEDVSFVSSHENAIGWPKRSTLRRPPPSRRSSAPLWSTSTSLNGWRPIHHWPRPTSWPTGWRTVCPMPRRADGRCKSCCARRGRACGPARCRATAPNCWPWPRPPAAAGATAATSTPSSCSNCATSATSSPPANTPPRPATSPSSSASARRAFSSIWKRPLTCWPTVCCNWRSRRGAPNGRGRGWPSSAARRNWPPVAPRCWPGTASASPVWPAWARRPWPRPSSPIGRPRPPFGTPSCPG